MLCTCGLNYAITQQQQIITSIVELFKYFPGLSDVHDCNFLQHLQLWIAHLSLNMLCYFSVSTSIHSRFIFVLLCADSHSTRTRWMKNIERVTDFFRTIKFTKKITFNIIQWKWLCAKKNKFNKQRNISSSDY